eukprot:GFKZ01011638.1.p1 GENE.GFKZ01011638.1~~GFKZ01011638.1.p1  ORF type:complete len:279 (-),score=19.23 GFKZ01011638.1:938-1774(-)
MSFYLDNSAIGRLVPPSRDVVRALRECTPGLASTGQVRIISNLRAMVVSVQDKVVVKYGYNVRRIEADAMEFVSSQTSMPVPKVFGSFTCDDGRTYIVMEFVQGETLEKMWPSLSEDEKQELALQLRAHLNDVRKLKGRYIGALSRLPCMVCSLQGSSKGPFSTEKELNEALVQQYEQSRPGYFGSMLRKMLKDSHEIMFSHSDLHMRNILVRHKQIVAVLDWECAGFFPEYWEYAHAYMSVKWNSSTLSDWALFVQACLSPYPSQAATVALIVHGMI